MKSILHHFKRAFNCQRFFQIQQCNFKQKDLNLFGFLSLEVIYARMCMYVSEQLFSGFALQDFFEVLPYARSLCSEKSDGVQFLEKKLSLSQNESLLPQYGSKCSCNLFSGSVERTFLRLFRKTGQQKQSKLVIVNMLYNLVLAPKWFILP